MGLALPLLAAVSSTIIVVVVGASAGSPTVGACPKKGGAPPHQCKHAEGSYRSLPNSDAPSCCAACLADSTTPCAGWILASPSTTATCHLKMSADDIIFVRKAPDYCGLVRNVTPGPPHPPAPGPPPNPPHPPPPPPTPPPPPPPPTPAPPAPPDAKNVLLVISDDMRPELPMYGNSIVHAPNLQRIADRGVTFGQAHVQFAYCCPTRNSCGYYLHSPPRTHTLCLVSVRAQA